MKRDDYNYNGLGTQRVIRGRQTRRLREAPKGKHTGDG